MRIIDTFSASSMPLQPIISSIISINHDERYITRENIGVPPVFADEMRAVTTSGTTRPIAPDVV